MRGTSLQPRQDLLVNSKSDHGWRHQDLRSFKRGQNLSRETRIVAGGGAVSWPDSREPTTQVSQQFHDTAIRSASFMPNWLLRRFSRSVIAVMLALTHTLASFGRSSNHTDRKSQKSSPRRSHGGRTASPEPRRSCMDSPMRLY